MYSYGVLFNSIVLFGLYFDFKQYNEYSIAHADDAATSPLANAAAVDVAAAAGSTEATFSFMQLISDNSITVVLILNNAIGGILIAALVKFATTIEKVI